MVYILMAGLSRFVGVCDDLEAMLGEFEDAPETLPFDGEEWNLVYVEYFRSQEDAEKRAVVLHTDEGWLSVQDAENQSRLAGAS